jgi:NAD dependent epimerase/dehydratase
MNWASKKVLVTGAGGFIGSHLVELVVQRGANVRALVRYNSRGTFGWLHDLAPDVYRLLDIVCGDLRDADTILRAVKGCDVVFHLGAMISIPYSYVNPTEAVAINVDGTLNVLNACRFHGVERLVHTSTSETYGTAQYVPIDEQHPLQGQSPYSASKIGADKLAESFFRSFDLPVTTVRPFNTYGPRQSARALIPTIMVQLLTRSEINLGSLLPTRDFTFVTDTAEGMLRAAEVPAAAGRLINLGSGNEISVADLAAMIIHLSGKQVKIGQQKERVRPAKSEVDRLLSDNTLARELLGWQPTIGLKEGLSRTLGWVQTHLSDYQRAMDGYVI